MGPRIEQKPGYRFVGQKKSVSSADGKALLRIRELWDAAFTDGTAEKLQTLSDSDPGITGVCLDYKKEGFTYLLSVSSKEEAPSGMEEVIVTPGTWAVFRCEGVLPDAMQKTWKRIYNEWFPKSDHEHADAPEIEVYPKGDRTSPDYCSWIWILLSPQRPGPCRSGTSRAGSLSGCSLEVF